MIKIALTDFAERHFDKKFGGTKILDMTPEEFVQKVNDVYDATVNNGYTQSDFAHRFDGYADFCKLFFIKNDFSKTKTGTMKITLENYPYLRSDYSARRKGELPVMSRWFEIPKQFIPKAKWFNVILYTREQLYKEWLEGPESKEKPFELSEDVDFGIVAILAQATAKEEPMKPETMLRNYMPLEFGGSGMTYPETPEEKEKFEKEYERSSSFWQQYATVK